MIAILMILSAALSPAVGGWINGQATHTFLNSFNNLPAKAKNLAVSTNTNVALTFDGRSFRLGSTDSNGDSTELGTLSMPDGVDVSRLFNDGKVADSSDWKINFYPDGSSDGGGIELSRGNSLTSLSVDKGTSLATVTDGEMPDGENTSWPAGDYVQRSG